MVTPLNELVEKWILVLSFIWGLLINIQDLRDLAGDRLIGRKTLPIVIGETATRVSLAIGFAISLALVHFVLMMPTRFTLKIFFWELGQVIFTLLIIGRIFLYRSPSADEISYKLTTYLYCFLLASAVAIL